MHIYSLHVYSMITSNHDSGTCIYSLHVYAMITSTTKYWSQSTSWIIMSEVVLLPNTDRSQQVEGLFQRLCYYQILTAVNKLKDYVRGCTTTKYWPQSTSWRIMSEVVILPNTDRSQQVEGLCQRLYYYQIMTAVNKLKDYVRGCTTTK
jgi:hypothetical protein